MGLVPSGQDIPEGVSWRPFIVLEVPVSDAGSTLIRRDAPHALLLIYLWSENPDKEEDE